MIVTATVLAILITWGFAIIYKKLPKPVKGFLRRRYILLDIFLAWATFSSLGYAIIGMMTAAIVSLFVSLWLYWEKQRDEKEEKAN